MYMYIYIYIYVCMYIYIYIYIYICSFVQGRAAGQPWQPVAVRVPPAHPPAPDAAAATIITSFYIKLTYNGYLYYI